MTPNDVSKTALFSYNYLIKKIQQQKKLDEQAESVKKQYGVDVYTIAADLSSPEAAQMIYDKCRENGYQELNSFLRAFSIWTGMSVSEYRKKN